MFIHCLYFIKVGFGTGCIKKYGMDLNFFSDTYGETSTMCALKLTIDLHLIDFQNKAVDIGVNGSIRFLFMLIINNRVIIFTTTAHKREQCYETY